MSVITKGFSKTTVITRGFNLLRAVEVAIQPHGRSAKYDKIKRKDCDEYQINVSLISINDEDVCPPIKNKLIAECEKDKDLRLYVQSVDVKYKDYARDAIIITVKCLKPIPSQRKKRK